MPDQSGPARIRVIYVDDDGALVRLVQKALGRQGFEVTHARGRDEARTLVEAGGFDVIALDHYLPTGTGLDLLSDIGGSDDCPPVVYVTGSSETNVAVAALKAGAADFVAKTVGDDFIVLLRSALEQAVEKGRLKAQKDAAEKAVRVARDRAELLLAEVNHRIANSLALVASLVGLQAKAVGDQASKDALAETQARIYAVSSVHKRLYTSGDVRFVELDEYLSGLMENLRDSMRSEGSRATLSHLIEPLKLGTDAAVNLGIVVTEWVTNAFKYAYPNGAGDIRVRLRLTPGDVVELTVEDDGVGRPDGPAKGTGLGTRIVRAMATNMRAEVRYDAKNPGTMARLAFPLHAGKPAADAPHAGA